jgi:hypothetical protein
MDKQNIADWLLACGIFLIRVDGGAVQSSHQMVTQDSHLWA